AENYPGQSRVGDVVVGSDAGGVLHAGTARRDDGAIVSSGGRVLSVVGTGPDLAAVRSAAYEILGSIRLPGSHFRTDIGLAGAEGSIRISKPAAWPSRRGSLTARYPSSSRQIAWQLPNWL